ncbi:hypothetical protein ACQKC5_17850, partial [Shewanella baltica]|uniref:hypothetical protein n=1 Tax=Shewanella baltica TaxID=62322 RepID=UPI003D026C7C
GVAGSSPVRSANISISPNSNVRAFSYLEFIYFYSRGPPVQQHPCLVSMPLVHELIFTRQHKDESLYSNVEAFFVVEKLTLLVISQAVIR